MKIQNPLDDTPISPDVSALVDASIVPLDDPGVDDGAEWVVAERPLYIVDELGRLTYVKYAKRDNYDDEYIPIANFSCQITGEIIDDDNGTVYQISGRSTSGREFTCEISATEYTDSAKLHAVLESAAWGGVYPGQRIHLGMAIKEMSDESQIDRQRRFHRTGWFDGRFLIPGREPEGVLVEMGRTLPFEISPNGDLEKGLQALKTLLEAVKPEQGMVILSHVLLAPMAKLAGLGGDRYGLMLAGGTGAMKTERAMTFMSLYGAGFRDDERLLKLGDGATPNAVQDLAKNAGNMPFLVDNFKVQTGLGTHQLIGLIHALMEGGSKHRLNQSGQQQKTHAFTCWPILTGENLVDDDSATLARLLVVETELSDVDSRAFSIAQRAGALGHLSAVGGAWLDWLEKPETQDKYLKFIYGEFIERRDKWAKSIANSRPNTPNPFRIASNLAANECAMVVAKKHPVIGPVIEQYIDAHRQGLIAIANSTTQAAQEAQEAQRFLSILSELITSGRYKLAHFNDEHSLLDDGKILGFKDSTGIYLLPKVTEAAVNTVEKINGGTRKLYEQLDKLGVIASKGSDQVTVQKKLRGSPKRLLHLRCDALDAQFDELPI